MAAQHETTAGGAAEVAVSAESAAPQPRAGLGRRGLIAAAAAFVAGLAARGAGEPERVSANGAAWTMPYDSGAQNTGFTLAAFTNSGNGGALSGISNGGTGVLENSTSAYGVNGFSSSSYGVYGVSSSRRRVYGNSSSGDGVLGNTNATPPASNLPAASGVVGIGNGANTAGVYGDGGGAGVGVFGFSATNVGVFGVSGGGSGQPYGVVGSVNSAPGFGLFGVASVAGTVGFAGGAGVAGAIAGQFAGPVNIDNNGAIAPGDLYVQGNSTVVGTKSAAVPHPDGTHRLLYCVESPEAWFEDFGEGRLSGGKGAVTLDADFAAVVDTRKLHVFLTEHDENNAVHVTKRTARGFTVQADGATMKAKGKTAEAINGTFSYRVVARRKDVAAPRLAKFTVPQEVKAATPLVVPTLPKDEKKPTLPPMPEPPTVDKKGQGQG